MLNKVIPFFRKIKKYDIVFITPPKGSDGWILEAIAREISNYIPKDVSYSFNMSLQKLDSSKAYFFMHYMFYYNYRKKNLISNNADCFVWFTHIEYEKHNVSEKKLINVLKNITGIFCTNSSVKKYLIDMGCNPNRVHLIIGGADPKLFLDSKRNPNGVVGFCGAFYERKCPDKIFDLIKHMKHRNFLLIGRRWSSFSRFNEMQSLPNFQYVEPESYSEYPRLYAMMTVFVSTSNLEGGPIPLIEAMMSNVVPVVSNTGFAEDLIKDDENGYIFQIDADVDSIANLVDKAFLNKKNIRETVYQFSWKNFSLNIMKIINNPL